jgi:hypothetical protein
MEFAMFYLLFYISIKVEWSVVKWSEVEWNGVEWSRYQYYYSNLLVNSRALDDNDCGTRKPKYSEKTCPSSALSTTDATWLDPGSNPCRRGGKPATNRLNYSTAIMKLMGDIRAVAHSGTEAHGHTDT